MWKKGKFDLLIRLTRKAADNEKRFSISVSLQNGIKSVLPLKDACFDSSQSVSELIIGHKFPSSRWVNGETINETAMTEEEIERKSRIQQRGKYSCNEKRCMHKNERAYESVCCQSWLP